MNENTVQNLDEFDLSPFLEKIYKKKISILFSSIAFSFLVLFSSYFIPNKYVSYATLQPVEDKNLNVPNQIGGLASFVGLDLQDSGNKTDLALEILTSIDFFESLYFDNEFLVDLMAAKKFNTSTFELEIDSSKYDQNQNIWIRNKPNKKPTIQESHEVYLKSISTYKDRTTQFVEISFKHISPLTAQKWLDTIIKKLNDHIKELETKRARSSLEYLMLQISQTDITEIKEVISSLIQKELSILTISAGSENYVFNIIDSPRAPEKKSEPSRIQFLLLGFLVGLVISIFFVFTRIRE